MPQYFHINTNDQQEFFLAEIGRRRLAGKKTRVMFVEDDRTPDQNSMSQALFRQVSSQSDDMSYLDIRAKCKLEIGVPLLRADDDDFDKFYRAGLIRLTYEEKIEAMKFVPVTSIMKKKVFSEFLDEVVRTYSQQGMSLVNPSEAESYER